MSFDSPDRGSAAAPRVAALLAEELGWSAERRDAELAAHDERVTAERNAEAQGADADAAAAVVRLDEQRERLGRL